MSIMNFGIDTGHIIKLVRNGKSLATLAEIEDAAHPNREFLVSTDKDRGRDMKLSPEVIKECSQEELLNHYGIISKTLSDGTVAISEYRQPSIFRSFSDVGIDETRLIDNVSTVFGDLILRNSALESTGSIKTVNGHVIIAKNSKIKDLSSLKEVYGYVWVEENTPEAARKRLKDLKFAPEKFSGKLKLLR